MKNRVIKFRAWDNGEMFYQSDKDGLTIYNIEKLFSKISGVAILMQFTGLHDKNGVEIYEGDIVKFPEYYETPEMTCTNYVTAKVLFIHCAFHIQQKDEKIKTDTYNLAAEMDCYDGNFEVIGNIYQNPAHSEIGKDGGR